MKLRRFALWALVGAFVLGLVGVAFATGHGAEAAEAAQEGGHAEAHGIPWGNFALRVANLVLFIGIIWWAAGDKLKALFGGRRKEIREELDDLETRKAQAEEKLRNVERGIANLNQEKQKILDDAQKQGEAMRVAIIEKAERDAEAMKEQAKRTAENEAKAAMDAMRADMAELVADAAAKMVREKLSEKDHERLVDEYLTKVVLN
ncbi:MAG: ATP synthase F0 subunit B [Desulfovibrio sp.]|nr:ATP synthase F0 subunit B [Desulfovibrio sp.]